MVRVRQDEPSLTWGIGGQPSFKSWWPQLSLPIMWDPCLQAVAGISHRKIACERPLTGQSAMPFLARISVKAFQENIIWTPFVIGVVNSRAAFPWRMCVQGKHFHNRARAAPQPMEFVMSRFLVFSAAASLLSLSAQAGLTQEVHESPDARPGTSDVVLVEVEANSLYSGYDLASSGRAPEDMISVTKFASSGKIDASSRDDQ